MRTTQHKEAQRFLILGCALQSIHYSQRSITSFQTQIFAIHRWRYITKLEFLLYYSYYYFFALIYQTKKVRRDHS